MDPPINTPEFSVSELAFALKRTVEDRFGLVRVRGEISGLKRAASGHVYLALKDDQAVLDGVMWKGVASHLPFRPEDGLEVICTGKLTTYPGRSKYQIVIDRMEPAGIGALMALLEERRVRLTAEGLFDPARKRPLPYLPQVIGVVTSPTGAVIRDILHRLNERFPRHVLLWPVLVQGEGAAQQIAAAINGFNALPPSGVIPRPDLLIIARGGGSIEDLWAFNEEIVVRAAAASAIPLISAVGHETDTTLIDFAADQRAPTPTAAAEMAVPVRADLRLETQDLGLRMERAVAKQLTRQADIVRGLARALPTPRQLLGLAQQRFDELSDRLPRGLRLSLETWARRFDRIAGRLRGSLVTQKHQSLSERLTAQNRSLSRSLSAVRERQARRLGEAARLLETLSYRATLERGYAVVRTLEGKVVSRKGDTPGRVQIEFADGSLDVHLDDAAAPPVRKRAKGGEQGSLF
jgi:exodeoxyribonuclease VII large subunit